MKFIYLGLGILLSVYLIPSTQASTGYIGRTITEYDLTGCQQHKQDPQCKQIIKVACNSICIGHTDDDDFGRACKQLCTRPPIQKVSSKIPPQESKDEDESN